MVTSELKGDYLIAFLTKQGLGCDPVLLAKPGKHSASIFAFTTYPRIGQGGDLSQLGHDRLREIAHT